MGSCVRSGSVEEEPLPILPVKVVCSAALLGIGDFSSPDNQQQKIHTKEKNSKSFHEVKPKTPTQALEFVKFNQNFTDASIEVNICVGGLLAKLYSNQILKDQEYYKLKGRNDKSIRRKENRIRNLQARRKKIEGKLEFVVAAKLRQNQQKRPIERFTSRASSIEAFDTRVSTPPIRTVL